MRTFALALNTRLCPSPLVHHARVVRPCVQVNKGLERNQNAYKHKLEEADAEKRDITAAKDARIAELEVLHSFGWTRS